MTIYLKIFIYHLFLIGIVSPSFPMQEDWTKISQKFQEKRNDITIEEIKGLSSHQGLDERGNLTPKGAYLILLHMGIIAKYKDIPENIEAAITVKHFGGSSNADQIFGVTIHPQYLTDQNLPNVYVIKESSIGKNKVIKNRQEMNPQKELKDLMRVEKIVKTKLEAFPNIDLSIPEGVYYYWQPSNENSESKKRYIIVMPAASGKDLYEWTDLFLQQKLNPEDYLDIMFRVGQAVGTLHYVSAPDSSKELLQTGQFEDNRGLFQTLQHGDLHMGNIFFDTISKKITFIDIGEMGDEFKEYRNSIAKMARWDLYQFYMNTKYQVYIMQDYVQNFEGLNAGFDRFVRGYVSALSNDPEIQDHFYNIIINIFKGWTKSIFDYFKDKDELINQMNIPVSGNGGVNIPQNYFIINALRRSGLPLTQEIFYKITTDNFNE